jgi:CHAD domain-containing protein
LISSPVDGTLADMAYEIQPDIEVSDEVRRVATELVTNALEGLRTSEPADHHSAVHEARKRGKELRALLRLVRRVMGDAARKENIIIRDAGRTLSSIRDATSVVECVDAIRRDLESTGDETAAVDELGQALCARRARVTERLDLDARTAEFTEFFEGLEQRIPTWPVDGATIDDLTRSLARYYGRGRTKLARASGSGRADDFHEWRKRVKDHRYHLSLLRPLWPPVLSAVHEELKTLSDYLGDEHDLTVLEGVLDVEPELLRGVDADTVRAAIDSRRQHLRAAAMPLGRRVYAETRSALERRMLGYARAD